MHVEHFAVNYGSNWQIVEEICELLPNNWTTILALAFDIKAIYLSDLSALVVAAKNGDATTESHLETKF